jgi:hypothetical protein
MDQIQLLIDQRAIQIENQRAHGTSLEVGHESFILIWLPPVSMPASRFLTHHESGIKESVLSFIGFVPSSRKL